MFVRSSVCYSRVLYWNGLRYQLPPLFHFTPTYWGTCLFCPPVEAMHAVIIMSLKSTGLQSVDTVLTSRQIRQFSPNFSRTTGSEAIEKWEGKELFWPPCIEIWRCIRPPCPTACSIPSSVFLRFTRKEQVILNRLLIGHTHLTHSYLLNKEQPPNCNYCKSLLTVEHVLTSCSAYKNIREKHYYNSQLPHILTNISNTTSLTTYQR